MADLKSFINTSSDKIKSAMGVPVDRIKTIQGSMLNFTEEYKAILRAVVGSKPSSYIMVRQNRLIERLKGNNKFSRDVFSKFACFIPYFSEMPDKRDALIWWNNPSIKATLSTVNPDYNIGYGFTGVPASSTYVNTKFNATVHGGTLFTQNSAAWGKLITNYRVTGVGQSIGGGTVAGKGNYLLPKFTDNAAYYRINQGTYDTKSLGDNFPINKLFIASRTGAENYKLYSGKSAIDTGTIASTPLQDVECWSLASPQYLEYSGDSIGLDIYSSALDDTDIEVINDAVNEFVNTREIPSFTNPGILLGFDDTSRLAEHHAANIICKANYNWKASFFYNGALTLLDTVTKIHDLLVDGNEIGNHTAKHINWHNYLLTHTVQEFFDAEIKPQQSNIYFATGLEPDSFAYSQVSGIDAELNDIILSNGFKRIKYWQPSGTSNIDNALIYPGNKKTAFEFLDTYEYFNDDVTLILAAIDYAKSKGAILPIMAHGINDTGTARTITQSELNQICQKILDEGMSFYRLKDVPV